MLDLCCVQPNHHININKYGKIILLHLKIQIKEKKLWMGICHDGVIKARKHPLDYIGARLQHKELSQSWAQAAGLGDGYS